MKHAISAVPGRILDGLRRLGADPALTAGGRSWTGAQVAAGARRVAARLQARGLAAGHTLVWSDDDLPGVLGARLAALLIGAGFEVAGPTDPQERGAGRMSVALRDVAGFDLPGEADADVGPAVDRSHQGASAQDLDVAFCLELPGPVAERGRVVDATPDHVARPDRRFDALVAVLGGTTPDDGRRVAILSPVSGFGGEVALAAWGAGRPVHLLATGLSAARALAAVERCRAVAVASPPGLLRSMVDHPAAALADLSSLQTVLHEQDVSDPRAIDTATVRKVFGATAIEVTTATATGPRKAGEASPTPASTPFPVPCLAAAIDALDAEFAATDWPAETAVVQRLGQTALRSMLNAFLRCGLFASPHAACSPDQVLAQAKVAPPHRQLVRRWLRVLEAQGLLRCEAGRLHAELPATVFDDDAMRQAWAEVEAAWREAVGSSLTIDYARRNAEQLPELLAGRLQAVHLLFPEGRLDLARALYRESVAARYQHAAVRSVVRALTQGGLPGRPLRLIELGAGTGATTDALLPALDGLGVDYLYTDVSRFFLDAARTRFGRHDTVRFGRYDIDAPPQAQGHVPHSVDLVVAGGMLNAARDTDASLGWLRQLLRPGGFLVFTEPTVEEFWVMASQAFMLPPALDERAASGSTFLSLAQWRRSLDAAGFEHLLDLPRPGHPLEPLGHRLFAVRAPLAAPSHSHSHHSHG